MERYTIQGLMRLLDQILLAIEMRDWDSVEQGIQKLQEYSCESLPVSEVEKIKARIDYIFERLKEEREKILVKISNTQQLKRYKF